MNWTCAQFDERLDAYLEGRLAGSELAAAESHATACPRCAEWADARRATLLLRTLELEEVPPGLETRILAQTLAAPAQESVWEILDLGWRALLRPRVALGVAAAVFSLALVVNTLNVPVSNLTLADLNPVNIVRGVNRQAQQSYAAGVRFLNDLRLVYEIRSRLEEMRGTPEPEPAPAPPPSGNPPPANPEPEKKQQNSSDGAHEPFLFAQAHLGTLGELR